MIEKAIFQCKGCGNEEYDFVYINAEKHCGNCGSPMVKVKGEVQKTL